MRWWRSHSVRVRLTLWYIAAMVVVLGVYATVVYGFVSRSASAALDQRPTATIGLATTVCLAVRDLGAAARAEARPFAARRRRQGGPRCPRGRRLAADTAAEAAAGDAAYRLAAGIEDFRADQMELG